MDRYIANLNIQRFEEQLAAASDEATRTVLRELLLKEREKLAAFSMREESGKVETRS